VPETRTEAIGNAREALELWFQPSDLKLPKKAKLVEVTAP
jgi:predicted RNase H-like HicB family nuclease